MPTPDDLAESRERWLQGLRDSVAEQVAVCRDRLDDVLLALEGSDRAGPVPVEARAFFAAEAGANLVASARHLQRASASCCRDLADEPDVRYPERCRRVADHEGDCDADPASLVGDIRARAVWVLRAAMVSVDDLAEVEFRLHEARGDLTALLSADLPQHPSRLADSFEQLAIEMQKLSAHIRGIDRQQLASRGTQPCLGLFGQPDRRLGADASGPSGDTGPDLGGLG